MGIGRPFGATAAGVVRPGEGVQRPEQRLLPRAQVQMGDDRIQVREYTVGSAAVSVPAMFA